MTFSVRPPHPAPLAPTSPHRGKVSPRFCRRLRITFDRCGTSLSVHLSPLGRGRRASARRVRGTGDHVGRSVRSISSNTPGRFSYTSMLVMRSTKNPHVSSASVRLISRASSTAVECVAPSTSTISLPSNDTKSTMYPSTSCWRRNFHRASFRFRSAYQSRVSAFVCEARSARALCLNRSIPLTRPLRGRPLPTGERYTRGSHT